MDSAAQRGRLRRPGTAGAGAAVGAEDILFLVRKVCAAPALEFCIGMLRKCHSSMCASQISGRSLASPMRDVLQRPSCFLPCHSLCSSQDPKKYARAKELLIVDEEIRKARQTVEDVRDEPE